MNSWVGTKNEFDMSHWPLTPDHQMLISSSSSPSHGVPEIWDGLTDEQLILLTQNYLNIKTIITIVPVNFLSSYHLVDWLSAPDFSFKCSLDLDLWSVMEYKSEWNKSGSVPQFWSQGWLPNQTTPPREQFWSWPVRLRGEDAQHGRPVVDLQHVCQRLQNIKVEEGVARDGAVQSGFEERRPVTFQHPRWTAVVILTNTRDSGENHLRGQQEEDPLQVTTQIYSSHCLQHQLQTETTWVSG